MSYEPSLNELLEQTANAYGLRDVLTGHGIPKDEPVICKIRYNSEVIASCQIPQGSNEVPVISVLTELEEEMGKMINQGEDKFELLTAFPGTQTPPETLFELILDIGGVQFGEPAVIFPRVQFCFRRIRCCPCSPTKPNCCSKSG